MNKNETASNKTTQDLIHVARNHFSRYGYTKTSLESIVKELNITRGALYHHFKSKKSLFLAVVKQVQIEVSKNVENEAMRTHDTWDQLIAGCVGFIEAAILESNKRILLIDAPNVIEWSDWRKLDNENSVAHLKEQLTIIQKQEMLIDIDISFIAYMVSGALNELSLYLADSGTPSRETIYEAVACLLKGFKRDGKKT